MAEIAVSLATMKAEELVGKLVDKLYSTVSGELSLLQGVRGEIQYIKDELVVMSAFLRRAEEKQNSDPAAKAWVEQVKELAYAVEDCIDEFALHLPKGNSKNLVHALWRRARSLGSLQARHRIAADIQRIKSTVEEVSKRRLRYGIDDKASSTSDEDVVNQQYDPRSTALFVEDSQLVGIDGPRDKLVEWLLNNQQSLRLMAVVGAGGLGKTTVVKRAVESPKVTGGHFDCRAWVTVSQVYRIEGLLRDMIKQIFSSPPEDLENMGKETLIEKLKGHLMGKRYAIVFDDIWKVDTWKSLEVALPRNTWGSKIIITTRIDDVAGACLACNIPGERHEQEKLSEDESWELFCKRVFFDQRDCPEELKMLSQKILKKCDGLPLAIVAIAAALASKPQKTSEEWKDMLTHLSTELESNPHLQGVMRVLNFSYTDLPYHVKQCFLYLSKFPQDSLINWNRIKRLWIAEGLVCAQRGRRAEEVAESHLNVLLNRRLILPSELSLSGKVKSFTIHDMMMEMIVSKSIEENFVSLRHKEDTWLPQGVIRRLSINVDRVPEELSLSYARSLTMSGDVTRSLILSDSPAFRLLRVLDLEGCRGLQNDHLKVVCQLLHLKYLSLRDTDVSGAPVVPDSIGNLRNLETLDFRGCNFFYDIKLPAKILKLKRLRLLRGSYFNVPTKIGKLRAIQELGLVQLEKGMVKDLQYLDQLKKLKVWIGKDLEEKHKSDFCDFLKMESNSLRSMWVRSESLTFLMKDVSSAPVTLEKLVLQGRLSTLPEWISSLRNLHKISFADTYLGADAIQALGALPSLLRLDLQEDSYCEEKLTFGAEGFPSLKVLRCVGLHLRSLIFEQGALPCVESVHMIGTHWFQTGEMLFTMLGLENLTCLKTVEIETAKQLAVGRPNEGVEWLAVPAFSEIFSMCRETVPAHPNHAKLMEAVVKQAVKAHPNHPKLIIIRKN